MPKCLSSYNYIRQFNQFRTKIHENIEVFHQIILFGEPFQFRSELEFRSSICPKVNKRNKTKSNFFQFSFKTKNMADSVKVEHNLALKGKKY